MTRKMLIDATHPEETRVVVVNGNKVEEFDFDSTARGLVTGNIYLAKVTRVEPSLQAAFVDYGGNRHGFLAFAEVHPDYYQIPQADREALLNEELAHQEAEAEAYDQEDEVIAKPKPRSKSRSRRRSSKSANKVETEVSVKAADDDASKEVVVEKSTIDIANATPSAEETVVAEAKSPPSDVVMSEEQPAEEAASSDEASGDEEKTIHRAENSMEDEKVQSDVIGDEPSPTDTNDPSSVDVVVETAAAAEQEASSENLNVAEGEVAKEEATTEEVTTEIVPEAATEEVHSKKPTRSKSRSRRKKTAPVESADDLVATPELVTVDEDEAVEEVRQQRQKPRTSRVRPHQIYKIQEVIKVRQIMLVQVVKEERGNKGAALTTYLSLPGRYCVLMPNTARGGGISRKISNIADRKRLKTMAKGLSVPKGAGLIIRTAGAKQELAEIERDYAFLTRQWNQIRELTLSSTAPAPVYAESGPIKRAIRDLLTTKIDEILVEGEDGFKEAQEYMNLLMPDRVEDVTHYNDTMPLFARYQVESYLGSMFNPTVQLKSGGYLVFGVTEALIAVDVNSGRSTKESSIEDTAVKTNLEAAEEVARQLKLRDLAGLIVIDFIDMEQRRHQSDVENKLKDALRKDRARIQVGRISSFGLLEMSRQRLRTGLVEASTQPCAVCHGTGIMRSDDNLALSVIRAIEEEISRGRSNEINAHVPFQIANFLFNEKRDHINSFEDRHGVLVRVIADHELASPNFRIEKLKNSQRPASKVVPVSAVTVMEATIDDEVNAIEAKAIENVGETTRNDEGGKPKRRRRRGGKGRNRNSQTGEENDEVGISNEGEAPVTVEADVSEPKPRSRTSSTRGRKKADSETSEAITTDIDASEDAKPAKPKRSRKKAVAVVEDGSSEPVSTEEKPKRKRRTKAEIEADKSAKEAPSEVQKPRSRSHKKDVVTEDVKVVEETSAPKAPVEAQAAAPSPEPILDAAPVAVETSAPEAPAPSDKPKRRGWWSRG